MNVHKFRTMQTATAAVSFAMFPRCTVEAERILESACRIRKTSQNTLPSRKLRTTNYSRIPNARSSVPILPPPSPNFRSHCKAHPSDLGRRDRGRVRFNL
jgi:hypothetical protein